MRRNTGWILPGFLALFTGALSAQEKDPEAFQREIESLRPGDLAWKKAGWLNCPLKALRRSRSENKPIVVWVFLGNPADERC